MKKFIFLLPSAFLLFALSSCANVPPYDRGITARYGMRTDRDPLSDTLYEHIYFTREAASGGKGVGGGGCGCN